VEWVEVRGRTVTVAVEGALAELGIESAEDAEVEIIQEPEKGFLGIGRADAIVRVKAKPKKRKRRRKARSRDGGKGSPDRGRSQQQRRNGGQGGRDSRQSSGGQRSRKQGSGKQGQGKQQRNEDSPKPDGRPRRPHRQEETMDRNGASSEENGRTEPEVTMEDRVEVVQAFLEGLIGAFGLEGEVKTYGEDEVVFATVDGPQTEALIGERGAIMQSVHEITRTVAQRKIREGTRLRLDVAGYAERRREALQIYAKRLAEQVLEDGGEAMLEPMNPSDRKVIHDAIGDIDGVSSYSEGEDPRRSVVISAD
jgi:spoIIIJ-associated protein